MEGDEHVRCVEDALDLTASRGVDRGAVEGVWVTTRVGPGICWRRRHAGLQKARYGELERLRDGVNGFNGTVSRLHGNVKRSACTRHVVERGRRGRLHHDEVRGSRPKSPAQSVTLSDLFFLRALAMGQQQSSGWDVVRVLSAGREPRCSRV